MENPYWQFFCGFEFFQHEPPIDASTMTRWRKRIGPEGPKASVDVALETGTAKPGSLERITVDTTVQPKAIAHPTDSRLYLKAIQILVRQARRDGIMLSRATCGWLRQRRCGRVAMRMPGSSAGCVANSSAFAPISAGCSATSAARSPAMTNLLGLVERLLAQKPKDRNKIYSLHAPEVVCIAKGKAHNPYEFGCKVGIAATVNTG
ncbi:hypothetical protein ABID19_006864 [Mesorhizobium robiniae]|uniref:Transposase InsH N-terminal domain-containing protein n=1 Tax=Mesorhizobium robiniae TaxID=559315 RepID=A0ABV2GZT1_9HYPH